MRLVVAVTVTAGHLTPGGGLRPSTARASCGRARDRRGWMVAELGPGAANGRGIRTAARDCGGMACDRSFASRSAVARASSPGRPSSSAHRSGCRCRPSFMRRSATVRPGISGGHAHVGLPELGRRHLKHAAQRQQRRSSRASPCPPVPWKGQTSGRKPLLGRTAPRRRRRCRAAAPAAVAGDVQRAGCCRRAIEATADQGLACPRWRSLHRRAVLGRRCAARWSRASGAAECGVSTTPLSSFGEKRQGRAQKHS